MSAEEYLDHLYEHSVPFRLYAEHQYGLSMEELACLSNKPVSWIEEQIEAMRLCLEKQVRLDFPCDPQASLDAICRDQVWD